MPTHRPPGLSTRGSALVDAPALPAYLAEHFARSAEPYDEHARPDGYIPMCIAENRLVWDLIEPKVSGDRAVTPDALGYFDMVGPAGFRADLASFLGRRVFGRPVAPEHIAVLAGAGSILETLFYLLADPGEGVLIPTPSYAGFWMDLEVRDALRVLPVHTNASDGFRLTPALLDDALDRADCPVRVLLFTTPNNPMGTVYSEAELRGILDWAESRGIHVVFDEIYALSVFGDRPFTSTATLRESLGDHVHLVWAFSKDFAASGLRCGVLVSENAGVLAGMGALSYWACCSGDTLHLLRSWVTDDAWLDRYLPEMRRRLGAAHDTVCTALSAAGIPVVPGGAGFFVLVDLRAHLDRPDWESEDRLWRRILDEANVNLTPGVAIRSAEPGLFRLCFASVSPTALAAGLARLVRVLS
ncbi:MAG: aminotransferase class I/II-fold pyridoxal phosphate-dependent enzyme [Myxococcota bacterium]